MGILGDVDGTTVGEVLAEHPLGTSTKWESSSFEHRLSEVEQKSTENVYFRKCHRACETDEPSMNFFDTYCVNWLSPSMVYLSV